MFIWKKEFELGIDSIDEQHQKLLSIGNRISDLISVHEDNNDNYDEILDLIAELKAYTIYHFRTEEDLFIKYEYPEYLKHKREHDGFIEYINTVNLEKIEEDEKAFLTELLKKIVNWVFNHIITTDFMYRDFLVRLGMR